MANTTGWLGGPKFNLIKRGSVNRTGEHKGPVGRKKTRFMAVLASNLAENLKNLRKGKGVVK